MGRIASGTGCKSFQHPLTRPRRSDILCCIPWSVRIRCISINGNDVSSSRCSVAQRLGRSRRARSSPDRQVSQLCFFISALHVTAALPSPAPIFFDLARDGRCSRILRINLTMRMAGGVTQIELTVPQRQSTNNIGWGWMLPIVISEPAFLCLWSEPRRSKCGHPDKVKSSSE